MQLMPHTGDEHNPNMLVSELKIEQDFESFGRPVSFKSPDLKIVTENPKSQNFRCQMH